MDLLDRTFLRRWHRHNGRLNRPPADRVSPTHDTTIDDLIVLLDEAKDAADGQASVSQMQTLYEQLAWQDPERALNHALENGAYLRSPWTDSWLTVIFTSLASTDREAALRHAAVRPRLGDRVAPAILSTVESDSERAQIVRRMGWILPSCKHRPPCCKTLLKTP